jgi:segregation and condensation protein A
MATRELQQENEPEAPASQGSETHGNENGALKISLPLYEGPLDLLLDLIRRQKLDISDIPIARVTGQYLDYLHLMEEMNVNVASDFLLMAAQLIYIKSRTLLPPDPDADPEEDEDPRDELVRRLLEYEKFKDAAQMLYQKELVEKVAWTRPGKIDIDQQELEPEITVTLFDMMSVFRDILKRFEDRTPLDVDREEFTVEQMARLIHSELARSPSGISFRTLMERFSTRRALITAFLALLELARLQALCIGQKNAFDDIQLRANPKADRVYDGQSFSPA